MTFDVPVVDSGDVWGTLVVRVLEIFESIKHPPPGAGQDAGRRAAPDRGPGGPAAAPPRAVHGRGAPRRIGPLRHHRRGEPARAVARPRPDLPEPAGRAADAPQQPVRRFSDHPGPDRPLLLLHGPGRGHRRQVGPPARPRPGRAREAVAPARRTGGPDHGHRRHLRQRSPLPRSSRRSSRASCGRSRPGSSPARARRVVQPYFDLLKLLGKERINSAKQLGFQARPAGRLRLDPGRRRPHPLRLEAATPWAAGSTPSPSSTC